MQYDGCKKLARSGRINNPQVLQEFVPNDHDEEETKAPEEANNIDPTISRVLDGVSIREFVSFDDNSTTTQTLADDCEEEYYRQLEEMLKRTFLILSRRAT